MSLGEQKDMLKSKVFSKGCSLYASLTGAYNLPLKFMCTQNVARFIFRMIYELGFSCSIYKTSLVLDMLPIMCNWEILVRFSPMIR